jgi:dipeptidyl aminopeptidase/acylaminoacyl peptidase
LHGEGLKSPEKKDVAVEDKHQEETAKTEPTSRIVFERNKRIWVMNPDGTGQKQLTWTGEDSNPALSPDGKYVIFQRRKETVENGDTSSFTRTEPNALFLISADGNDPKRLTPPEWDTGSGWTPLFPVLEGTKWLRRDCLGPSFSGDGSKVCFKIADEACQENPGGGRGMYGLDAIAVLHLEGTEPTGTEVVLVSESMHSGPFYYRPRFSPGGEYIFFSYSGGGGPPSVGVDRIDTDGKNRTVVIPCEIEMHTGGIDRGYYGFEISPDGRRIACVEVTMGESVPGGNSSGWNTSLCLFDANGAGKQYIDTGGTTVGTDCICFSPDGAGIAFTNQEFPSGDESAKSVLFVIGTDGSGLTEVAQGAVSPDWK